MPRRGAVALTVSVAALALLLSFKTPDDAGLASSSSPTGDAPMATASASPAGSATVGSEPSPTSGPTASILDPAAGYADGTVTGSTVQTRYGPVQVQVTIEGGVIVDVSALQLPSEDGHSASISDRAEPILREAALAAQSAEIDVLSGATYTSQAYARSLQSALDLAAA
jgi:uncharacterized protein with FMN-binding domain